MSEVELASARRLLKKLEMLDDERERDLAHGPEAGCAESDVVLFFRDGCQVVAEGLDPDIALAAGLAPRLARAAIKLVSERDILHAEVARLASALEMASTYTGALERDMREARLATDLDAAALKNLRAIVEGRTAAPTDAEIKAHWSAGGMFRYRTEGGGTGTVHSRYDLLLALRAIGDDPARWWAFDATGRPCAWPTVPT